MGTTAKSEQPERANSAMPWRIVVCGSMSAYAEMVRARDILRRARVRVAIPVAEDNVHDELSEDEFAKFKRQVSYRHLRSIRHPSTFAVLALNKDKAGIRDYIGPNTFAEIAVAFAQSKRIYLYQGMPSIYRDELHAWGAVCLQGNLARLTRDFRAYCDLQSAQLSLFR